MSEPTITEPTSIEATKAGLAATSDALFETPPRFLDIGEGDRARDLAVVQTGDGAADAPGFVWLGGYRSDMAGGKASALAEWGARTGRTVTRFDYSGHGLSGGAFEEMTLVDWLEEAETVLAATRGPQVLVGSSMGGWLALKLAERLRGRGRVAGLLLIAPAWNMASLMEAGMSEDQHAALMRDGVLREETDYGTSLITRDLIETGKTLEWGDAPVSLGVPVRIIQGMRDEDVPALHVMKLLERIADEDVRLAFVKDGDHRLSRPQDLSLMLHTAAQF